MNNFKSFKTEYQPISIILDDDPKEIIVTDPEYSKCLFKWDFVDTLYGEDSMELRKKNTLHLKRALFERGYSDEIERYFLRLDNSWIPPGYKELIDTSIGLILDRNNTIKFVNNDASENIIKTIKSWDRLNSIVENSLFNALHRGTSVLVVDMVPIGTDLMPIVTSISPQKIISVTYKETLISREITDIIIMISIDSIIRFSIKNTDSGTKYVEKREYKKTNNNSNQLNLVTSDILTDNRKNLVTTIPVFAINVANDNFKALFRENPYFWGYAEQTEKLYNLFSQSQGLIDKFAAKFPFLAIETDIENPPMPGEPNNETRIQQQIRGRSGHDSIAVINRGDKVTALSPDMRILEIAWEQTKYLLEQRDKIGISSLLYKNGTPTATGENINDQNKKSRIELVANGQSTLWENVFKFISQFYGETEYPKIQVGYDFSDKENMLTNFTVINDSFDRGAITLDEYRLILKQSRAFGDATDSFEPTDLQQG